jgi:hypothetical protein
MENNQKTWITVGVTAIGSVIAYLGYSLYNNSSFPENEDKITPNALPYEGADNNNSSVEVNAVTSMRMKPPTFLEAFWKNTFKNQEQESSD